MKVAVCFSGLYRGEADKNIRRINQHFPYDTFFGVYHGRELGNLDPVYTFPEMEPSYHPGFEFVGEVPRNYRNFIRNGMAKRPEWKHRTKQILAHASMMQLIPKEYDMIVRVRYDTKLCDNKFVDVDRMLEESYKENKVMGFYVPKGRNKQHLCSLVKNSDDHNRCYQHLPDHMIFHRRDQFNVDLAWHLHDTKQLIVAEWGWYQVLCNNVEHHSYLGYAGVDKV